MGLKKTMQSLINILNPFKCCSTNNENTRNQLTNNNNPNNINNNIVNNTNNTHTINNTNNTNNINNNNTNTNARKEQKNITRHSSNLMPRKTNNNNNSNKDYLNNNKKSQSNKNVQKQKIKSRTSLIIEKHLKDEFERLHKYKYQSNVENNSANNSIGPNKNSRTKKTKFSPKIIAHSESDLNLEINESSDSEDDNIMGIRRGSEIDNAFKFMGDMKKTSFKDSNIKKDLMKHNNHQK